MQQRGALEALHQEVNRFRNIGRRAAKPLAFPTESREQKATSPNDESTQRLLVECPGAQ